MEIHKDKWFVIFPHNSLTLTYLEKLYFFFKKSKTVSFHQMSLFACSNELSVVKQ